MTIIYFDCFSGISGDMILGALVDAGLSLTLLSEYLQRLPLTGYHLVAHKKAKGALVGTKVEVVITEVSTYHRDLNTILEMVNASTLSYAVKQRTEAIFRRLAQAEALVHGTTPEEVHFHEVGAIDSIVDIVGTVIGLDLLSITAIFSSPLPLGGGFTRSEHGLIPLPGPATLELIRLASAPTRSIDIQVELVTPTGAAILSTLANFSQPAMQINKIGYGLGTKDLPRPNALRVWLGELTAHSSQSGELITLNTASKLEQDHLVLLETNIDDMSGELYGYLMECLFDGGALDVFYTPIFMKKNRPATMISVLAPENLTEILCDLLLRETTTLGVRITSLSRRKASRSTEIFLSSFGPLRVKRKEIAGELLDITPEYDDCSAIARATGLPLQEVFARLRLELSALKPGQTNYLK